MDLRPELLPPPVSPQRLAELGREIERIADLTLQGEPGADEAIAAFNELTGHRYEPLDFVEYQGSRSLEGLAAESARPARPRVPGITRHELSELVHRVQDADPDADYYLRLLEANLPHPRVADLILQPAPGTEGVTAEQIVDAALSYRPIAL
ncbi:hypothetical protein [Kitasatospora sp. NPDC002040]|uniref:hypothetical protein n=1 Tax=Kitasatospora sp. NPDC002040 TaxID=3154661 RepID=UPI00331D7406